MKDPVHEWMGECVRCHRQVRGREGRTGTPYGGNDIAPDTVTIIGRNGSRHFVKGAQLTGQIIAYKLGRCYCQTR